MRSAIAILLLLAISSTASFAQVTITVDTTTRFQTIEGWGHGGDVFSNMNYSVDSTYADSLNYQTLDYLIDDLGLTGSRMWEVGPRTDGTGMDNGDCDSLDWTKFEARPVDFRVAHYVNYFKRKIEAAGYKTSFYSSTSYPSGATLYKPWVMNHPGERAQQIWANALWWKNNFGIDINYAVIFNEPSGVETPSLIAEDIKALGPRLQKLGLPTKIQFAEGVAPQTDWGFITPEETDSDIWQYIGRLSYHNYGTADPYRSYIRDYGIQRGIPTAQTEMGSPTIDDIFNDMIFGGVSYWEIAFSGSNTLVPNAGNLCFTPSATYFRLRQVIHYVRPGMIRVASVATDSMMRTLAFTKNGAATVIILNLGTNTSATLHGLPAGRYGVSQCIAGAKAFQELGPKTIGADGMITLNTGSGGVTTTLYPLAQTNHPPSVMTWGATPGYITAPVMAVSLSASATDADLDPLTYLWTVASQPSGAMASIATPTKATTNAAGLTAPGMYVFKVSVSDGTATLARKVYMMVYATNPPPEMGQAGFRIAAPYGLVFADPPATTHANVELPISAVTLQVGIGDLANSDFTARGTWSLVSQPAGANAIVSSTTYIYISIRANATGMTVPGDYVFNVNVTNPGHADLTTQIICTVHAASTGPVINSISANPALIMLPVSASQLTATTSDPQLQLLRHWWAIKSTPAGAKPIFDHQGLPNSNVSSLTVPGTYVFTLRSYDDIHMTTKDVTVVVQKSTKSVATPVAASSIEVYPNPVSDLLSVMLHDPTDRLIDVKLCNALGQTLIEEGQINSAQTTLDLRPLPVGVYFLRVLSHDKLSTIKVVRE